ncbi:hypothetical protein QF030_000310 [Streptomyces rishiriensis]|uniref:Transposase IS701-like DDE domain-containing protein n=1 Tax=Streptomyces rishiriensis TaxID=68264 RepID=A0ABU0NG97_STRRH|nr:hypothetical protein [Streptomyces rishiriensis]
MAPQYCGALGKRANCKVAVSVHAAADAASCLLQRRLFLPQEWTSVTARRALARILADAMHREKWRLALDTLVGWGMRPPVVVADAVYGTNTHLRTACPSVGSPTPWPSARTWRISYMTTADRLPVLEAWLHEKHPYDVPQWITLPVTGGSEAYLSWVVEETHSQ